MIFDYFRSILIDLQILAEADLDDPKSRLDAQLAQKRLGSRTRLFSRAWTEEGARSSK